MITTIRGRYSNGQVLLQEPPPTESASEVLVIFTGGATAVDLEKLAKTRQAGFSKGTVLYMAPDFDAPLDELKEYR